MEKGYVTASEIADYVYCKRGWMLRIKGQLGENEQMKKGSELHDKLASFLMRLEVADIIVKGGLSVVGLILIIMIIFFLFFYS